MSDSAVALGHRRLRRRTFPLGAFFAVAFTLPLTCFALVGAFAALGVPPPDPVTLARYALVFAGLPAILTGGGVARAAAHRAAAAPSTHTLRTAVQHATPSMALVGAGLAVLIAVPLGGLPPEAHVWAVLPLAGLVAGAPVGLALGWLLSRQSLY